MTINVKTRQGTALPEDVDSFSRRRIRRSVDACVTIIILVNVDGIVLANAVLYRLHRVSTKHLLLRVSKYITSQLGAHLTRFLLLLSHNIAKDETSPTLALLYIIYVSQIKNYVIVFHSLMYLNCHVANIIIRTAHVAVLHACCLHINRYVSRE